MPADEQATAAAWKTWLAKQHTMGNGAIADYANPEQMNRYTWYVTHDWKVPYPGDSDDLRSGAGPGRLHPEPGHELTDLGTPVATHAGPPVIRRARCVRARGIGKSFGEVVALDGVDLDIAEGQVHGLVGPNGAGKTTLLGLLLGLAQADGGELEILGSPVRRTLALPDGVAGFVDGPGLYPSLTARQNLAALARLRGDGADGIDDALEQVGLTDVADDRVRGFSLGMRQRLGLAAALLTRPRLLVLDEPANGLDPAGTRHVHRVLTRLAADGAAVVLSSHRMDDLAALCSEVTILATGRVVFSGPIGALVADIDELDYRLRTSDPDEARRVAAETPGLRVLADDELLQRQDAQALLVRAAAPALDDLVARLVGAGVGVRELAPVVTPLEAAFLALTADHEGGPVTAVAAPESPAEAPPPPVRRGYRFEIVKLLAQWPIRLAILVCWLGPALIVGIISRQSSLPSDTVFGRWMGQTGWAGSLVVLAFACSWLLPLLTSVVAGDVFATEDRLGTWRHLLVAMRSPRRIFAAKALASLTIITLLVVGLAASGIVGGLTASGNRPLVGLDGHLLTPGHAAGAVLLAWATVLAPTLAFAAVGLLGSVALGRSPMGLMMPALLALVLAVVQLLPLPVIVRVALPSYAFIGWRGLFTDPTLTGPLVAGIIVSLAWAVAACALAYRLFMRRDFTDLAYDGAGRRVLVASGAAAGRAARRHRRGARRRHARPPARGSTRPSSTARSRRRSPISTSCRPGSCTVPPSPRPTCTPAPPATRAARSSTMSARATTGAASSAGASRAPRPPARPSTSSTSPRTAATSPTATDRRRSTASSRSTPSTGDAPNPLWQFDGLVNLLTR